jgi:hypothetical protein
MLSVKNISSWWFFGRSSKFCGLPVYQRRGDLSCGQWRLFCFSPVIAFLFFVAGVLSMLEMLDEDIQMICCNIRL